jgi:Arc/MetJ family transcription regulator
METRTNIVLDDALVNQVMVRAGVKTKKAAIEAALKAYIRKPNYSAIMALRGTGVLADDDDDDANEAFSQTPMPALRVAEAAPAPAPAATFTPKRKVAKT